MASFRTTLLVSDLVLWSSLGLVQPFLALIVTQKVAGATALHVGYAFACYFVSRLITQLVTARSVDRASQPQSLLKVMLVGSLVLTAVPFGYLAAGSLVFVYALQVLWGIGEALVTPAWFVLFNESLMEGRERRQWTRREALTLLGAAGAAVLGGLLIARGSYGQLFIVAGLLAAASSSLVVLRYRREAHGQAVAVRMGRE